MAISKRWLGRQVDRVFLPGNRELMLKIEGLEQRARAVEEVLKIDDLQLGGVRATEEALVLEIDSLQQRATATEEVLTLKIDGLQQRATATEEALTLKIDGLQQRATATEEALTLKIDGLQQRATATEEALTLKIDGLQQRATATEEALTLKIDGLQQRATATEEALTLKIDGLQQRATATEEALTLKIDSLQLALVEALESLRCQQEALRKELEATQDRPPTLSDALGEVYGAPPALHPIPGWTTYWGVDNRSEPFRRARAEIWSSLKKPVLMRWLADLTVMIWPGNELSRVLFLTGTFEPNELTWMSRTLTKGMTVIDIGAQMGMYTLTAAKLVGESGVVVAVEPSSREFQRLTFHVTVNDLRNVRCLRLAA